MQMYSGEHTREGRKANADALRQEKHDRSRNINASLWLEESERKEK